MSLTIQDCATLHNGVKMPWLGLGVWQSQDGDEVVNAVRYALDAGYRSIDTAAIYKNERGVGRALRDSGVSRDNIFLTTKVWNSEQGYDNTLRAFDASLEKLGQEYVDLYLVHWPVQGSFKDTWKALEALYRDGRTRAIGVSNFLIHHLEELLADCEVKPMVNQIEFHPRLVQQPLLNFCKQHQIVPEAWAPIMKGKGGEIPEIKATAEKYGKSAAQILIRWDIQKGVITIPKSVHKDRIVANADIFDFELTAEDVALLDGLDKGERIGPDPDNFDF